MVHKKKKKGYIFTPAYIFCFKMYECFQIKSLKVQKETREKKKYWKHIQKLFFVLPHWRIIFFYFAFLQKFEYVFFVKRAQPLVKD